MSEKISFTFNGEVFTCERGQSVAAALISAENRELRRTRFENEPRSIFCGIGICYDCVVVIDSVANQRSCLIEAKEGMKVVSAP